MVRDGTKAGTGYLMAINNSPMVSYRNTGLHFDRGVMGNKEEKKRSHI